MQNGNWTSSQGTSSGLVNATGETPPEIRKETQSGGRAKGASDNPNQQPPQQQQQPQQQPQQQQGETKPVEVTDGVNGKDLGTQNLQTQNNYAYYPGGEGAPPGTGGQWYENQSSGGGFSICVT